jgi:hypothetical protein
LWGAVRGALKWEKGVTMAARCFCGCGEKVPWRLGIVSDLGEAVRQRRRDLASLLNAGLRSARAERFIRVLVGNEDVLARSIHVGEPLGAEMGRRTSQVLMAYELLYGAEALSRAIRGVDSDLYTDEMLRQQLGVDLGDLEAGFTESATGTGEGRRFRARPIPLRRESALE